MTKDIIKIFFFGDSICYGQGVSIHKGWVSKIAHELDKLGESFPMKDFLLCNASVNGNTTRLALERMPYDIQSHHPEILLVQFGMNDCNYWDSDFGSARVSTEAFKANIKEIVSRGFKTGCKVVILNTNHPSLRDSGNFKHVNLTYEQSNKLYNKAIRDTFHELQKTHSENILLNDIEVNFNSQIKENGRVLEDLVLPDKLHLSEEGHKIYFDTIFPTIKKCIDKICNP